MPVFYMFLHSSSAMYLIVFAWKVITVIGEEPNNMDVKGADEDSMITILYLRSLLQASQCFVENEDEIFNQ